LTRRFSPWLYAIATNLARDAQRYRTRHPNVSLEAEASESGHRLGEMLPDTKPGPTQSLESAERAEAVRQAVAALPAELQVPLVLFTYEEKSHAEIAEILDCSAKAVEMRLYHARNQLRERLERLLG
jgi:RNA polymerase sigma-70 factor (ECF subfamily)